MGYKFISPEQKNGILEAWNLELSTNEIAKKLGYSRTTVKKILKELNVKPSDRIIRKSGYRKGYDLNDSYFDSIDSEDKAYWLGFLCGDAQLNISGFKINQSAKDKEHLIKLCSYLNCNKKIIDFESERSGKLHPSCKLEVASPGIHKALKSLRVAEIKSKREIPIVGSFAGHFWRGVWDADGGICKKKNGEWALYFSGTELYVKGFGEYIQSKTGIEYKIKDGKGCKMINWHRKEAIKEVIEALYVDATIYLDRKKTKVDEFTTEYNNPVFKTKDGKIVNKPAIYSGFDSKIPIPEDILTKMSEKPPLEYKAVGEAIRFWHFPDENITITQNLAQKTVFVSKNNQKNLYYNI